jgi:hypothetical protein
VPIPRELALILARHKHASRDVTPEALVFAARSGRPLSQRNVARALRKAQQRATDERGEPTFPVLQETATDGRPFQAPAGAVPSMHSFRHTVASRALLAGESVDEVAFLLGHRDATVTRTIYLHEIADARRRQMRRSRMTAEYAGPYVSPCRTRRITARRSRTAHMASRSPSASTPDSRVEALLCVVCSPRDGSFQIASSGRAPDNDPPPSNKNP